MVQKTTTATRASAFELVIRRIFDAPPSLLFKMWTTPEHLVQWFGPRGFTASSADMDVRPGGVYRAAIRSSEGKDYWFGGVYREVVEPALLAFTFAWETGNRSGVETLITVTFTARNRKTVMTLRQAPFRSRELRDTSYSAWSEEFDKLDAYVAKVGGRTVRLRSA